MMASFVTVDDVMAVFREDHRDGDDERWLQFYELANDKQTLETHLQTVFGMPRFDTNHWIAERKAALDVLILRKFHQEHLVPAARRLAVMLQVMIPSKEGAYVSKLLALFEATKIPWAEYEARVRKIAQRTYHTDRPFDHTHPTAGYDRFTRVHLVGHVLDLVPQLAAPLWRVRARRVARQKTFGTKLVR